MSTINLPFKEVVDNGWIDLENHSLGDVKIIAQLLRGISARYYAMNLEHLDWHEMYPLLVDEYTIDTTHNLSTYANMNWGPPDEAIKTNQHWVRNTPLVYCGGWFQLLATANNTRTSGNSNWQWDNPHITGHQKYIPHNEFVTLNNVTVGSLSNNFFNTARWKYTVETIRETIDDLCMQFTSIINITVVENSCNQYEIDATKQEWQSLPSFGINLKESEGRAICNLPPTGPIYSRYAIANIVSPKHELRLFNIYYDYDAMFLFDNVGVIGVVIRQTANGYTSFYSEVIPSATYDELPLTHTATALWDENRMPYFMTYDNLVYRSLWDYKSYLELIHNKYHLFDDYWHTNMPYTMPIGGLRYTVPPIWKEETIQPGGNKITWKALPQTSRTQATDYFVYKPSNKDISTVSTTYEITCDSTSTTEATIKCDIDINILSGTRNVQVILSGNGVNYNHTFTASTDITLSYDIEFVSSTEYVLTINDLDYETIELPNDSELTVQISPKAETVCTSINNNQLSFTRDKWDNHASPAYAEFRTPVSSIGNATAKLYLG